MKDTATLTVTLTVGALHRRSLFYNIEQTCLKHEIQWESTQQWGLLETRRTYRFTGPVVPVRALGAAIRSWVDEVNA